MTINADALLMGMVYLRYELEAKKDVGTIEPHEVEKLAELNNGDLDRMVAEFRARREEEGG